jgi:hypothetical protein
MRVRFVAVVPVASIREPQFQNLSQDFIKDVPVDWPGWLIVGNYLQLLVNVSTPATFAFGQDPAMPGAYDSWLFP